MAGEKLLTDSRCKAAKRKEKIYYLNDGHGLRLRISPNGSRIWLLRYRIDGKEKTMSLGSYPIVSLTIARAKSEDARQLVASGQDPLISKRLKRVRQVSADIRTFGATARDYLAHNEAAWSDSHYIRNEGILRRFLLPDLSRLPLDQITEEFLFAVIKKGYDRGTKDSARRARALAQQVFRFGKDTHRCSVNPAKDLSDNSYFKRPATKHFEAIKQDLVPELIEKLNKEGSEQSLQPQTVCGLLLAIYTGLRAGSIRSAKWSEFDFKKAVWTVPFSTMKSRREHQVPLPKQAIRALRRLEVLTYDGPESYVFASKTKAGYISENTLRLGLHRLGYEVTVHGFRSLLTDVLNENGFNFDAVERQLDHADKSQTRRAYLRSQFWEERVRMMQWFADWCEGTAKDVGNVVRFEAGVGR